MYILDCLGKRFYTPRFGNVVVGMIASSDAFLRNAGFTEPTYNRDEDIIILGKSLDEFHMEFAAAPRGYRRENV